MSDGDSLIDNLLRRRVLQIVGMYIAATWLVIELGDWVTERFDLPANMTSYVFIAMLVLLPSVALLAYGHGAPGRDRWTRFERFFVPVNIVAAGLILFLVDPDGEAEAATQMVQIADEMGAMQEFEVARRGYHRELVGFFWTNASGDPELDWLSYGLPILMSEDIDRVSPVVTVATPFNEDFLRDRLRDRQPGSVDPLPRRLAIQIARDRRSSALVMGSYDVDGEEYHLSARLIDAETGNELGDFNVTTSDWMDGVDRISADIQATLEVSPADGKSDDPLREHFADTIDAVRHFARGEYAIAFENDYPLGISEFQRAVELDSAFAEARGSLSISHYLNGDLESARDEASLALRDSYRLSDASKFSLKAQRYVYGGDIDRSQRVLDIWTEVQPNSTRAHARQARLLRLQGGEESLDRAQEAYDRLLELNPANIAVYLAKAEVEQQRGDYSAAAGHLQAYLAIDPDSGEARLQLAGLYQADGSLDEAQRALEDAAVLLDDPVEPGLALARLEARRGQSDAALDRLDSLLATRANSQQQYQLLFAKMEILAAVGRIREALDVHEKANELALELLPPLIRVLMVDSQKTGLLAQIGKLDEAVAVADDIMAMMQPPQSYYMNLTYSGIYAIAEDREAAREWAEKSIAVREELPGPMQLFITIEEAQLAVWDGANEEAIRLTDEANDTMSGSFVQLIQSDPTVFALYLSLAKLYLDAGATDKAEAKLAELLQLYPGNAQAKIILARSLIERGDPDRARRLLDEASALLADADSDYVLLGKIDELVEKIEAVEAS